MCNKDSMPSNSQPSICIKGWEIYDVRATRACATNLFNVASKVNRFHARYKFARSFQHMTLQGYSSETSAGYSALMKASLHWSAFEMFKTALNIADTRTLIERYPFESHIKNIRDCFSSKDFFRVIRSHLSDVKQKQNLDAFVSGSNSINPLVLAKSLRHIFFHGALTPNAGGASPDEVVIICEELCNYMIEIMNAEFEARANELFSQIG